jgi:NodT family efflux transporter outer membrane factor (OMF) lipoprotein
MIINRIVRIAAAATLLGGCAVGPDFHRPVASLPSAWERGTAQVEKAEPSQPVVQSVDAAWWKSFEDPELVRLEERVSASNLDVQVATIRLAQSRALRQISGAGQFPTLEANGSFTREQASANGVMSVVGVPRASTGAASIANGTGNGVAVVPGNATGSSGARPFNVWQYGFDASWELDFWGRARRSVEAADASSEAQAEARRDVLLSTLAEVARDYIELRGTQTVLKITRDNLDRAEQIRRLTLERSTNGLASELDVANASAQVTSERALLPRLEQQEAQALNRLSYLLGQAPGSLRDELAAAQPVPPVPPRVPIGIPSELARRRPDIREAEATLHAATAEIGVAKADFYPSITLSGSASMQALQFSQLGNWSSRQFAGGPSLSLPLFEGGRLKGTLALRKAQQQEAAVTFQRTVLAAWHEVDNALIAYSSEQQRHEQLVLTVQEDQRALNLAKARYTTGVGSFLQVLIAERSLLAAEQDLAQNTTTISTNLVSLYKSLGGGWESEYPESAFIATLP